MAFKENKSLESLVRTKEQLFNVYIFGSIKAYLMTFLNQI